ncbi:MAG TPA: hypothetical protein VIJ16_04080, partial [Gemmatimonadaceae bacterium]
LPATSIRDLVVKDSDLVIATHGRSFWILDDITPLRQLSATVASEPAHLFAPAAAFRIRRDTYTDTPLPPEEPAGQNPPDGAIIDYYINEAASSPVTLEILNASGHLVRRYASNDQPDVTQKEIDALNVPAYWVRPPQILSAAAGTHRWVWNLHYPDPSVLAHEYPISAIPHDTPRLPLGTSVLPGKYTVRLTVNGKRYTQPLIVKMDPRVHATSADLQEQFALSMRIAAMIERDFTAIAEARALHVQLDSAKLRATSPDVRAAIDSLDARVNAQSVTRLNGQLSSLLGTIDGVDARPTTQAAAAVTTLQRALDQAIAEWAKVKGPALTALNARLKSAGMPTITIPADLTIYRTSLQRGETADKDDNDP